MSRLNMFTKLIWLYLLRYTEGYCIASSITKVNMAADVTIPSRRILPLPLRTCFINGVILQVRPLLTYRLPSMLTNQTESLLRMKYSRNLIVWKYYVQHCTEKESQRFTFTYSKILK